MYDISKDFYDKSEFYAFLTKLKYNIGEVEAQFKSNEGVRERIRKLYKEDFLNRCLKMRDKNSSYYPQYWLYIFASNEYKLGELKVRAKADIDYWIATEPHKARRVLSVKYERIFKETLSPKRLDVFNSLREQHREFLNGVNMKLNTSYKKISEEKVVPFKTVIEYEGYILKLFNSKNPTLIFQALVLTTGLRPIDIKKGYFYITNGKLHISEIQKTKAKEQPIYTVLSPYYVLLNIELIQESNIAPSNKTIRSKTLTDLGINRDYDLRALYACSYYYFYKDKIKKMFGLSELETTKPAFLNKILHHVEGSSTFMNYSNWVKPESLAGVK